MSKHGDARRSKWGASLYLKDIKSHVTLLMCNEESVRWRELPVVCILPGEDERWPISLH